VSDPGLALCVNSGSSSVKLTVLAADRSGPRGSQQRIAEAAIEGVGTAAPRAWVRRAGDTEPKPRPVGGDAGVAATIDLALSLARELVHQPAFVVHRVVHGGARLRQAVLVDDTSLAAIEALAPLAPLHQPAAVAGMRAALRRWPGVPHVACFDTAFHADLPELAWRLPLPRELAGDDLRRYGFHGLSYGHVMWTLGTPPPERVVIAHLGNGSSLVAVRKGRSIDTTMGFTPAGGVCMGTRSGDLDPGVFFFLARERRLTIDDIERVCEHESGLRAVGGTSDMKTLMAEREREPRAALAVTMFAYGVRKAIGALAAALGGLDTLVFTGGIGAHVAEVRQEACAGLQPWGVTLDPSRNARGDGLVSSAGSACPVRVVAADEESQMVREALSLLAG